MQKCTCDACSYFYLQIRINRSFAFIPFGASMRALRGMILVIFIHEVAIVVNGFIPVALKAFHKKIFLGKELHFKNPSVLQVYISVLMSCNLALLSCLEFIDGRVCNQNWVLRFCLLYPEKRFLKVFG